MERGDLVREVGERDCGVVLWVSGGKAMVAWKDLAGEYRSEVPAGELSVVVRQFKDPGLDEADW